MAIIVYLVILSDHLSKFIEDLKQNSTKYSPIIWFRDYKKFNEDVFKIEPDELDWSFVTENTDVNLGFETFLCFV